MNIDIVIETTWAASTSYIPVPTGLDVAHIATTQYLQGGGGLLEADVRKYKARGVQINKAAVKYNLLKLEYAQVGTLVRA